MFERNSASVYVWDVGAQRLLWQKTSGNGRISSIVFSPDSQRLYVANQTSRLRKTGDEPWVGWDDHVRIWDINSAQQIDVLGSEFRGLEAVTLSPNEKIALLHYPDAVVLWDLEKRQLLRVWTDFLTWSSDIQLSPDGKKMVSMGSTFFASGTIKTWDVASQQLQDIIFAPEGEKFWTFAISPDNRNLAVVQDPWVQVRDLRTGKIKTQFPHRVGTSQRMAFSPSGRWIALEDDWSDLFILDIKNPKELQKIEQEEIHFYYEFVFSKNDEYLAASGRERGGRHWISVWKRERDTFVFQYKWQVPEHYMRYGTLAFGTNTVLAAAAQGTIYIWKLSPNRPQLLKTLAGGAPLHFSADTRYLFANRDEKLQIWDWRESTPMDYPSIAAPLAFSRDASVLLSLTDIGQVQIWDGKAFLPSKYDPIVPHGKQLTVLGEVKHNQLLQNFPNPFNPETWIPFRLADENTVTIQIYNATGQRVRRLAPGTLSAGDYTSQSHAIHWDGRNDKGERVSSGVYLYTIDAGNFSATRKMLITK